MVREHGDLDAEHRGGDGGAEHGLVALVIRMRDQGHTRREQFGPGGLDEHRAVRSVEGDAVVGAGLLPVFELGLGDRRAERHVPEGRRHRLVGLTALDVAQEGELRGVERLGSDGAVGLRPVDRQAQGAPERLELLLVFDGEPLAELDEVAAGDGQLVGRLGALVVAALERRGESRVVGEGRVAADSVVVLHAAFGRQAVVVPAHRVEDVLAAHAVIAGDDVGVRVAEHVADVQRARRGRRGSVDGVDALTVGRGEGVRAVEEVRTVGLPAAAPLRFEPFEGGLVWHRVDGAHGSPNRYMRHRVNGGVPECAVFQGYRTHGASRRTCPFRTTVRCGAGTFARNGHAGDRSGYAVAGAASTGAGSGSSSMIGLRRAAKPADTRVITDMSARMMPGCHHALPVA